MGTTIEKLQAIKSSKNAIRDKFNLGDIPFSQYAENINTAPGGIVVPGNFNPASTADVWETKQFFNCRGELQTGVFIDGALKSVYMANVNGKLPEKYYFLWGWYRSPDDDNLDYSPYVRVVSMPDGDRTFLVERKSDGNSFWWELYDANVGTVFFRSKARSASHEIWEITNDEDWEGVPDDLQGVTAYFQPSAGISYAPPSAFYLCGYVNRTYQTNEFRVSGLPTDIFKDLSDWEGNLFPEQFRTGNPNGTFAPYYKEGELSNWRWRNENGVEAFFNGMNMAWVFAPFYENDEYYISSYPVYASASYENTVPIWDSSLQWTDNSGNTVSFDIAEVVQPPVEKYWEGYKLEADENGKYNFASEKTKLTYGDYMPVAGRIYDAAATVEITNADLTEDALWACPRNMTSAENDEWVISASSEYASQYSGTSYAYFAFDGNNGSGWQSDYVTSSWLQWQNKKRAVVIKQISFYLNDQNDLNTTSYLQGSDDGATWTDIVRGQVGYPNTENGEGTVEWVDGLTKVTRYFKGSAPCYKYWRLGRDTSSNNHMNIRGIEAYSQLPREVPK